MPWSADFLAALSANPFVPRFVLDFIALSESLSSSFTFRSEQDGQGNRYAYIAGVEDSQQTVEPYPSRSSASQWRVRLAGDMSGVMAHLAIGSHAELRVGFPGWAESAFERVALGRLVNILRPNLSRSVFILVFDPPTLSMQTRLTTDFGASYAVEDSTVPLFYSLRDAAPATLSADYSPGDALLNVGAGDDLSAFQMEEGGVGLLRVVPSGLAAAAPFYLTFTSTATGLISLTGAGGQRGTTDAIAVTGSEVYPVALLRGHPLDLFRKWLTSTGGAIGTGTSGPGGDYDVLPASWGIDPSGVADDWLDHDDLDAWRDGVVVNNNGSASYVWDVTSEEPVDNALEWFSAFLHTSGLFLAQRQGCLVVRALQNMDEAGTTHPNGLTVTGLTITDADILLDEKGEIIGRWEARDAAQPFSSRMVLVSTGGMFQGRATYADSENHMLPAVEVVTYDQSGVYFETATDYAISAAEDATRLLCWHAQPREVLELRLSMRFAQVTIGDVLYLTTDALYGRFSETRYGYTDQPVMVLSHRVYWLPDEGPSVAVTLAIVRVEPGG